MNVSAESGAPRRAGQRHEVGLAQLPPAPPTTVAVIEGLATGTPRRVVNQSDAADRVAELFLDPGQRERIPRVYQKSRITTRRMAVDPLDAKFDVFRREPATIRDRMHLFYEHAVPLAVDVSKRALAGLPYRAAEIGLLVLATSTGFIAPGVDVAIVKELGLSPSISCHRKPCSKKAKRSTPRISLRPTVNDRSPIGAIPRIQGWRSARR